jgi:hypothetical protein
MEKVLPGYPGTFEKKIIDYRGSKSSSILDTLTITYFYGIFLPIADSNILQPAGV